MSRARNIVGPPEPPKAWSDEAKQQMREAQYQALGTRTPEDAKAVDIDVFGKHTMRNDAIAGFFRVGLIDIMSSEIPAVLDELRDMSTEQIRAATDQMKHDLQVLIITDIVERHSPMPEAVYLQLKQMPPFMVMTLPDELQALAMGVQNGVYDEVIASGVVPGSAYDPSEHVGHDHEDYTPEEPAPTPSQEFESFARLREAYTPFSGQTVSLNDLMAKIDDDEPIN